MKIIVVGAGEVGSHIAKILSHEGHDVTIIEADADKAANVQEQLDVLVLHGNAVSMKALRQAGIEKADLMLAVTNSDETNIVTCILANKVGVPMKIARVRNPEYTSSDSLIPPEQLGINLMIYPEEEAAKAIVRLMQRSFATEVIEYQNGRAQVLGIRIDSKTAPICSKSLIELRKQYPELSFRIVAISRLGRTLIPRGEDRIFFRDQIFLICQSEHLPEILKIMGKEHEKLENVMLLGGGRIGQMVAYALEQMDDITIKLIESNEDRTEELVEHVQRTLVLRGDGRDMDLLVTEGITDMDCYVALTGDDEDNLVSSLMAKHLGVKKAIALLNKSEYLPISHTIGLDAAVNPKVTAADTILRFIRRGQVISISTLQEIEAEVLELAAQPKSKITKKKLKHIDFPREAIIGAVFRGEDTVIPVGDTQINPEDKVIVFALPEAVSTVEKLFN